MAANLAQKEVWERAGSHICGLRACLCVFGTVVTVVALFRNPFRMRDFRTLGYRVEGLGVLGSQGVAVSGFRP